MLLHLRFVFVFSLSVLSCSLCFTFVPLLLHCCIPLSHPGFKHTLCGFQCKSLQYGRFTAMLKDEYGGINCYKKFLECGVLTKRLFTRKVPNAAKPILDRRRRQEDPEKRQGKRKRYRENKALRPRDWVRPCQSQSDWAALKGMGWIARPW